MKGSHRPFFVWPGRLVNFLTFKKGIDFFQKMSIIIIVKGIGRRVAAKIPNGFESRN